MTSCWRCQCYIFAAYEAVSVADVCIMQSATANFVWQVITSVCDRSCVSNWTVKLDLYGPTKEPCRLLWWATTRHQPQRLQLPDKHSMVLGVPDCHVEQLRHNFVSSLSPKAACHDGGCIILLMLCWCAELAQSSMFEILCHNALVMDVCAMCVVRLTGFFGLINIGVSSGGTATSWTH